MEFFLPNGLYQNSSNSTDRAVYGVEEKKSFTGGVDSCQMRPKIKRKYKMSYISLMGSGSANHPSYLILRNFTFSHGLKTSFSQQILHGSL